MSPKRRGEKHSEPRKPVVPEPTLAAGPRRHGALMEIALILIWALGVAHAYLNLDPNMIPLGSEFGQQSQANHLWTQVQKCGWCALWNGSEQGGIPALVDVHGSMLYPTVALTTLLWGVVNGVKISIVLSLWLAGVGQWWIARELKRGALARVYTAGIAVAGGEMAAKMDTANYQFIISTAAATLFLAGLLHWLHSPGRRSTVALGILSALFILSGQGYLQLGMLGVLPAAFFLVAEAQKGRTGPWRAALVVGVLALLLAGPLIVPFLHFAPNFSKELDSGTFGAAQPLEYLPLNLVISDPVYLHTQTLGKLPWPWPYTLFIGWIPVLLSGFGFGSMARRARGAAWFFGGGTVLAFFLGSGVLARAIARYSPSLAANSLVDGLRFPSVIASLAVPLILGLTAWGLDRLWNAAAQWPKLGLAASTSGQPSRWQLPLQWLLLLPLIYSLSSVYRFAQIWYQIQPQPPTVAKIVAALKTDSLEWVSPPFGIFAYIEPAVSAGLKLSPGFMDVRWRSAQLPPPVLIASPGGPPQDTIEQWGPFDGITIYRVNGEYASVSSPEGSSPCAATGSGGRISVACDGTQAGQLVVQENLWSGWYGWMDGEPVSLLPSQWLSVDAPPGRHSFEFRYLPWDVPLGLALWIIGIALCMWLWWRPLSFLKLQDELEVQQGHERTVRSKRRKGPWEMESQ